MPRFVPSFLKNQDQGNGSSVQQPPIQENQWQRVGQATRPEADVNNYATQLQQEAPSRFGRFVNRNNTTTTITPTNTPTSEYKGLTNDVSGNISRFVSVGIVKNKFETLSEDYVKPPVKNLQPSKPPRVGDSEIGSGNGSHSKSFASKFSEKQSHTSTKSLSAPSFIKIPKTESFEEFPSLGGTPKKTPSASSQLNELDTPKSTSSFANLAKGWAKKTEEEELVSMLEKQRSEKQRLEEQAFRNNVYLFGGKLTKKYTNEDEDEFGDSLDDEERHSDALDDGEEFEVPSGEEDLGESSEDDDDYDNNNGETPEYEERF